MNDTSPETEAFLKQRYAAMSGAARALMALQMFETAQRIVLSSLDPTLSEYQRRRELCRRFYGEELAHGAFPEPGAVAAKFGAPFKVPQQEREQAARQEPSA